VPHTGAAGPDTLTGPSTDRSRALWIVVPAGLVLAWAATVLPWATVTGSSLVGVVAVRGGRIGAALAVVGVVATVTAVVGWSTGRVLAAATVLLALGVVAVMGSGVLMLRAYYEHNRARFAPPFLLEYSTDVEVDGLLVRIIADKIEYLGGGEVLITDYKTGKDVKREPSQLYMYQKITEMDPRLKEKIAEPYG